MNLLPPETEILRYLEPYAPDALCRLESDRDWTREIKSEIARIGIRRGHSVCGSGLDDDLRTGGLSKYVSSEWLYDLVWYNDNENKDLIDAPLVLESEWGLAKHDIHYDFQKLLLAKSRHKVFLFQCAGKNRADYMMELKNCVDRFPKAASQERYLFACYDWDNRDFFFDLKVVN